MNPYHGKIRIVCTDKSTCLAVPGNDVQPECLSCNQALCQILDLDDKVLFEYTPVAAVAKARKPAKKKQA